ncbi:MAG: hypothetical protein LBG79_08425 [Spirochaetaceae bacterium]|jgi:hypothetical protein|nr:hypothetical protein [Spirochaetaceae bacterium]
MAGIENKKNYLSLKDAYDYLIKKGYENVVNEIKQSKDEFKGKSSRARRAKIVVLLDIVNLSDNFFDKYWKFGKTESCKKKVHEYRLRFLEIMEQKK